MMMMNTQSLTLLLSLFCLPWSVVAQPAATSGGGGGGGFEIEKCLDFASTVYTEGGFADFKRIILDPFCPTGSGSSSEGSSEIVMMPNAVNWHVHAVNPGEKFAITMTPENVFTPKIVDRELRFYLTQPPWNVGNIGVELSFPVGRLADIQIRGKNNGVHLDLRRPEGNAVTVTGESHTVYVNSSSVVNLTMIGADKSVIQGNAAAFSNVDVVGNNNDLELFGNVLGGGIKGNSNTMLVEGSIRSSVAASNNTSSWSYDVVGDGNSIRIKGGDCTYVGMTMTSSNDNITNGTSPAAGTIPSSCTLTNDTVTMGSLECTVMASNEESPCLSSAAVATAAASLSGWFKVTVSLLATGTVFLSTSALY